MDNSPEPTENTEEDARKSDDDGAKAINISLIGVAISFLLGLCAVSTLFTEKGDTAGSGFYIFGFLALSALVVSIGIALIAGLVEMANSIAITFQKNNFKDKK